jgi:hypothetical protein
VQKDEVKLLTGGADADRATRAGLLLEWGLVLQAMGFTPDQVRAQWDTNAYRKLYEGRIDERRRRMIGAYALASSVGDREGQREAREAIANYNRSEIGRIYPITRRGLGQSLAARARYREQAIGGIQIKPRLRERMEGLAVAD